MIRRAYPTSGTGDLRRRARPRRARASRSTDAGSTRGRTPGSTTPARRGRSSTVSFSRRAAAARSRRGSSRARSSSSAPSAPSLQDVHPTAVSGDDLMAGAEIQANAIDTVLGGLPAARGRPAGVDVAPDRRCSGCSAPLAALRLGPLRAALAGADRRGVVFAVAVQLAFNAGWIVPFLYPLGALVLGVGRRARARADLIGAFERERVRDLFARFVPEAGRRRGARATPTTTCGSAASAREVHRPVQRHPRLHDLLRDHARRTR